MSNFNELIKQKVAQFDTPYNDAHWAEMEGRLNNIRSAKIRQTSLIAAGTVAVIAISSLLYFNNASEINNQTVNNESSNLITNKTSSKEILTSENTVLTTNNEKTTKETNQVENDLQTNEIIEEKSSNAIVLEEKNVAPKNIENQEAYPAIIETKVPSAEFIVYNNKTCLGGEVSFESMENDLPISYTWNFGDGTISHKPNPTHIYNKSLVYTVTLTLFNRQTGIEYTTIQQDVVNILPLPEVLFTYKEESKKYDDNALKYPYTTFNVKDIDKDSKYQWVFGNGEISKAANTKTIYKNKGSYQVKLIATNSYGCENSTKKKVIIKSGTNLYAPNAFTPNADGENDNFIPKALLEWDVRFEMVITDLSNKVVYKTANKTEPWRGSFNNNGSILPRGIYLWKITTYDAQGKSSQHAGKVNLLN